MKSEAICDMNTTHDNNVTTTTCNMTHTQHMYNMYMLLCMCSGTMWLCVRYTSTHVPHARAACTCRVHMYMDLYMSCAHVACTNTMHVHMHVHMDATSCVCMRQGCHMLCTRTHIALGIQL